MVIRELSPARVKAMVRRSLPTGGYRSRWDGLVRQVSPEEIVSLYYTESLGHSDAQDLAFRILESLEQSVRVGQPSRRGPGAWGPLPDPRALQEDQPEGEKERRDLTSPPDVMGEDVRIDLGHAMSRLSQRSQDIVRLYYSGSTDAEIAKELGVSQQAVNKARLQAVGMLRKIMGANE
jgi:RNA polymerase sigma factor (sigma-70 family)